MHTSRANLDRDSHDHTPYYLCPVRHPGTDVQRSKDRSKLSFQFCVGSITHWSTGFCPSDSYRRNFVTVICEDCVCSTFDLMESWSLDTLCSSASYDGCPAERDMIGHTLLSLSYPLVYTNYSSSDEVHHRSPPYYQTISWPRPLPRPPRYHPGEGY